MPKSEKKLRVGMTVNYKKEGKTLSISIQKAELAAGIAIKGFFTPKGAIAFEKLSKEYKDNKTVTQIVSAKFDLNTANGTGNFEYGWAPFLSALGTRVFVVNVSQNEEGSLEGCGIAGYAGPIAQKQGYGKVQGFSCAFGQKYQSSPSTNAPAPYAQKQCFTRSKDQKFWQLTESKVKYVVKADCGKEGFPNKFDLEPVEEGTGVPKGIKLPTAKTEELDVEVDDSYSN